MRSLELTLLTKTTKLLRYAIIVYMLRENAHDIRCRFIFEEKKYTL